MSITQLKRMSLVAIMLGAQTLAYANTNPANASATNSNTAGSDSSNIEVSPDSTRTTPEELATIYVLSEICPNLIGASKGFDQGYARLSKDYWQQKGDPVKGLAEYAKQASFQKYLVTARANADKAGEQSNRDVCNDVIAYR